MFPKNSFEDSAAWAEEIVSQMTLEEKCDYVGGEDIFYTKAIERLGVKRVMMSDATAGINLRERFFEFDLGRVSNFVKRLACLPSELLRLLDGLPYASRSIF